MATSHNLAFDLSIIASFSNYLRNTNRPVVVLFPMIPAAAPVGMDPAYGAGPESLKSPSASRERRPAPYVGHARFHDLAL
ncbi:hypothetical protein BRAS3843_2310018 [Bradyrhizobium sp. STM 3843]|nr:hypothetical protein BRAS3843_2310018 [Bradyrhizobium sp. STM 3843]